VTFVLIGAEAAEELIRHLTVEFDGAIPMLLAGVSSLGLQTECIIYFSELIIAKLWYSLFEFFYL
jgi:hypothetical protein